MKMRKKLYIFKHFARSKKLFFCQYLSFSVWFPLSLKHWSPLLYSTVPVQKPNSWTNHFVEVSGHNLESSQTCGFCIDVLNHRFSSFTVYINWTFKNCKRLREFEEKEISKQSCRGNCELQGGKLSRLRSKFRPRIRPQYRSFPTSRPMHTLSC